MYDLVTNCFYDKTKHEEYKSLEKYRKDLLQNDEIITVTDFGAGSRVFKSKERKVSLIAKHVGISEKRTKFLFRLAKYLNCKEILELGTSLGIGTAALALNKNARVTSIEGCPQTAIAAQQQLEKFNLNNVNLLEGEFSEVLKGLVDSKERRLESGKWRGEGGEWKVESGEWREKQTINQPTRDNDHNPQLKTDNIKPTTHNSQPTDNSKPTTQNPLQTKGYQLKTATYDLIYFDGHHTKDATLNYFQHLLPTAHNDSVFVFDDIHWSRGMEEAWEIIKEHPLVKVSIDTFHLGLVFFRKEQAKQHFKIRL